MKNKEKYREQVAMMSECDMCEEFILPIILKRSCCGDLLCAECRVLQLLWLGEECEETETEQLTESEVK